MSTFGPEVNDHRPGAYPCPSCGYSVSRVRNVAKSDAWLRRRRQCPKCDHRWSTFEVPEAQADILRGLMKLVNNEEATVLRNIDEFCPKEMQIKSPGGLCFDPKAVHGIEAYQDTTENSRLVLHMNSGSTTVIRFHDNNDGSGPPRVYELKRRIMEAANAPARPVPLSQSPGTDYDGCHERSKS